MEEHHAPDPKKSPTTGIITPADLLKRSVEKLHPEFFQLAQVI
jgi:hypothetical protein